MPLSDIHDDERPDDEPDSLLAMARWPIEASGSTDSSEFARQIAAAIVDSADLAIIGKTLDGTIVSWNRGAEELYGYPASEVLGRSISIIVPGNRPSELVEILARLSAGERIEHYETERVRKDGSPVQVSVTVSPMRDSSGRIFGASSIARDISDKKQIEDEQQRQLERERHSLEEISGITRAAVTAGTFNLRPLGEGAAHEFRALVTQFGDLLEMAVEERTYRVDHAIHTRLRELADRMGFLNAGPRDVIEVHGAALKQRSNLHLAPQKTKVYAQEGQLLVLELMGYLAAYYRRHCIVPARSLIAEPPSEGREGDTDGR